MKVIIVGSGLIGLTTAYFLSREGHEVGVIDRAEGPAQETSFANGALLTPSMAEPWNVPGVWRVLLSSIGRSDAPVWMRLRALPGLTGWGIKFLRNSSVVSFERNALSNLRLALYSMDAMGPLREQTGIEYGRATRGSLRLFRERASLDRALARANRTVCEGMRFRGLSAAETVELEPGLGPIGHQLEGAIHYEADEVGDAHRFCVALTSYLRKEGVKFHFGTEISSLGTCSGRIDSAISGRERFEADQYIVAAGSHGTSLLRGCGVHVPVKPVKGYSITVDPQDSLPPLRIPLIDDQLHAVVVPLEGAIRIAGTAEFAGHDSILNPKRIINLTGLLQRVLPELEYNPTTAKAWCGLRAMSADGVPIIGVTPIANLMVNTGHGHLGWTMAVGSAQLLSDLMSGRLPAIDPAPYDLKRFG